MGDRSKVESLASGGQEQKCYRPRKFDLFQQESIVDCERDPTIVGLVSITPKPGGP